MKFALNYRHSEILALSIDGSTSYNSGQVLAIINLHGELVQFVKHISERAGIEGVERHQAYELLAKCEKIGKGETP